MLPMVPPYFKIPITHDPNLQRTITMNNDGAVVHNTQVGVAGKLVKYKLHLSALDRKLCKVWAQFL